MLTEKRTLAIDILPQVAKIMRRFPADKPSIYWNEDESTLWVERGDWENEDNKDDAGNRYASGADIEEALMKIPGVRKIEIDYECGPPEAWKKIDWSNTELLGELAKGLSMKGTPMQANEAFKREKPRSRPKPVWPKPQKCPGCGRMVYGSPSTNLCAHCLLHPDEKRTESQESQEVAMKSLESLIMSGRLTAKEAVELPEWAKKQLPELLEMLDRTVEQLLKAGDTAAAEALGKLTLKEVLDEYGADPSLDEKKDGWPKKIKKGRFTSYCKKAGFSGPSVACAKKAMGSDDASIRGMASFYMNTVKPGGKTASAVKGKESTMNKDQLEEQEMEPEIVQGEWYEIEGPEGTEWIPTDVCGEIDLSDFQPGDDIPDELSSYAQNQHDIESIKVREGYGARLSAPGYLDCTDWAVFDTEEEANEYLQGEGDGLTDEEKELPGEEKEPSGEEEETFVCPDCDIVGTADDFKDGKCPKCGKEVVPEESTEVTDAVGAEEESRGETTEEGLVEAVLAGDIPVDAAIEEACKGKARARAKKAAAKSYSKTKEPKKYWGTVAKVTKAIKKKH